MVKVAHKKIIMQKSVHNKENIYLQYTSRPAELMGRGRGSKESCAHALEREEASKDLHTQSIKGEYCIFLVGVSPDFFLLLYYFFCDWS